MIIQPFFYFNFRLLMTTFPVLKSSVNFKYFYIMVSKYKVLIVDDDSNNASLLGRFLIKNFFDVMLPATGFEMAKDLIVNNMPHIVLVKKGIGGGESETIKIIAYISEQFHLPMILTTQDEQQILNFKLSDNCVFIPHPAILSHYYDHILVAIDNLLNPGITHQNFSHIIEVKVILVPILKNGEPKLLKKENAHYCNRNIDTYKIPLVRANNLGNRNTCLLWEQNNNEYCLQESTSLLKLAKRHKDAGLIRISKFEMVMVDMILTYDLHHTINVDNHIVEIGKGFKKILDPLLLSIPRLNLN